MASLGDYLRTEIRPEGVEVEWTGSEDWEEGPMGLSSPLARAAYQELSELILDEKLARLVPNRWRLEFDGIWDLTDIQQELLQLPKSAQISCSVFSPSERSESGLKRLALDLRHDSHGVLHDKPMRGPFIEVGEDQYLLPTQDLYSLRNYVEAGPDAEARESSAARQQAYYARAKELAQKAGAQLEPWLDREEYVTTDRIGVQLEGDLESGIELTPEAAGVEDDRLQELLAQDTGDRSVVWSAEGRKRKRLILSTEQTKAVRGLHERGRHIQPEDVPDFIENPEAFLPPEIDLSEFSERVKGLRIRVYDSTPYVSVRQQKLRWFPEVSVQTAAANEQAENPEAAVSQAPVLSTEDYLARAREALAKNKNHFIHEGAVVRFDPHSVGPVLELEDRLGTELGNGIEGSRKYVLEIFENVDALEFVLEEGAETPDESDVQREILDFEIPEALQATLHGFQELGYRWLRTLEQRRRGGLLADDMGLGKTVQVISYLAAQREPSPGTPSLVVAPKTLLDNWSEEIKKFCPSLRLGLYAGGELQGSSALQNHDVILTTYDRLRMNQVDLARVDWVAVICDEAQAIKNPTTGRTTAVKALKAPMRVAVTGTPVENGLSELWSIMDWVQPGLLDSRAEFRNEHERPIVAAADEGARAVQIQRLQERILNHYLRRLKTEVLDGLPRKETRVVEAPLSALQVDQYLNEVRSARGGGPGAMLGCLAQLLRLSSCPWTDEAAYGVTGTADELEACPKLAATIQILDAIREKGEKALIFVDRYAVQGMLQSVIATRYGQHAPLINGKITQGRQEIVRRFGELPGFQVMILSPQVGGTGLNIVSANHVIHYMRPWNPAIENQATDRTYRIGQERDVSVYLPIATWPDESERSVEQVLDELIRSKTALATDVIVPTARMSLEREVLERVFRTDNAETEGREDGPPS